MFTSLLLSSFILSDIFSFVESSKFKLFLELLISVSDPILSLYIIESITLLNLFSISFMSFLLLILISSSLFLSTFVSVVISFFKFCLLRFHLLVISSLGEPSLLKPPRISSIFSPELMKFSTTSFIFPQMSSFRCSLLQIDSFLFFLFISMFVIVSVISFLL